MDKARFHVLAATVTAYLLGCGYSPPPAGTVGGKCVEASCNAGLQCVGGYCVPEENDVSVDATGADGVPSDAGLETVADVAAVPKPSDMTYESGGILATYYGKIPKDFDNLGDPILLRIESDLNLTKNQSDLGSINQGEPFAARYQGGLYVAKSGSYRMAVTASDSVRVTLGGVTLAEFWKAGSLVHAETEVDLVAGWYPLDIVYVRSLFQAHLQLWVEGVDGEVQPAGPESLGYDTELPEEAPELVITYDIQEPSYYAAALEVGANAPVRLDFLAVDGKSFMSTEDYVSHHVLSVPLEPATSQSVSMVVTDIWGRDEVIPLGLLTTPDIPAYQKGGLLGEYYSGLNFDELRGQRVDATVNQPYSTDGDPLGSFGMPIPANNFTVRWSGGIFIETAGDYTIYVGTDDGRRVWLDGVLVADAWYPQAVSYSDASAFLAAGWHPLTVEMYEQGGEAHAYVEWTGPGISRDFIPPTVLGFVMPPSDGAEPALENLTIWYGPETTTGNVVFNTSELTTTSFKITSKGVADVYSSTDLTTYYRLTIPDLPNSKNCDVGVFCDPLSKVEITLTDVEGNEAPTEKIDLSVKIPPTNVGQVDDFDGEMLDPSWMVVTQGDNDNTANWVFGDDMIVETGNANGSGPQVSQQYGTFLWNPDWVFSQGRFSAHVFAGDNDGFGLMYGIQDGADPADDSTWSYYRFSVNYESPPAMALRVNKDAFTLIKSDDEYKPPLNRWIMIEVERDGNVHTVLIDGVPILKFADGTFELGSIALYSWGMGDFRVDWVAVDPEL